MQCRSGLHNGASLSSGPSRSPRSSVAFRCRAEERGKVHAEMRGQGDKRLDVPSPPVGHKRPDGLTSASWPQSTKICSAGHEGCSPEPAGQNVLLAHWCVSILPPPVTRKQAYFILIEASGNCWKVYPRPSLSELCSRPLHESSPLQLKACKPMIRSPNRLQGVVCHSRRPDLGIETRAFLIFSSSSVQVVKLSR